MEGFGSRLGQRSALLLAHPYGMKRRIWRKLLYQATAAPSPPVSGEYLKAEHEYVEWLVDLSIIIINWNSVEFLRKCFASVYANTHNISFEVLVIDNASFDGSRQMVNKEFGNVRFIQSSVNLGFSRGNNLVFEHSVGRILLFLNPDTELVGPALECMVASMELLPDAGAIGPKLLNSDHSIQTSCLQSFPSVSNQALSADCLRKRFPTWSLWGNRALFDDISRPVCVEGISGACLMVRRSAFVHVGQFTSTYFMYGEDMDLCYKLQAAGWRNYYVPGAIVIHHGGQSTTSQSDKQFSSVMLRESLFRFMRIHYGGFYAQLFRSMTALAALCRLSLLGVAMACSSAHSKRNSLLISFLKWFRVLRWTVGLESWTKRTL